MHFQATRYRPGTSQNITVAAASAAVTNAFGSQTYAVRLASTTACWYVVAGTPVATTSDVYLPAGVIEIIKVNPGEKVAAIQASAGGTMSVVELS
jgi:hypothetical protein